MIIKCKPFSFICITLWFTLFAFAHNPVEIHTVYGNDIIITEPVLIELLQSDAINRLHTINQYGIMKFVKPEEHYTRYQHSVAVLYLLRRYGASLAEQVMGLLHDVSHTAFSHVADFLFDSVQNKYSYQDIIFEWYVEHTDLKDILERYNMAWITDITTRDQFKMLKNDMSKLCVDRLEYNLYGGYLEGLLTKDDTTWILDSLQYHDGFFVFTDYQAAELFADTALNLSQNIWCADWNCYIYSETARLLKYALDTNLITENDLIFSDDATIWHTLTHAATSDEIIQHLIDRILHYKTGFTLGTLDTCDYITQGKFRWIDPLIMTKNGAKLLSSMNTAFDAAVQKQKKRFKEPHYILYRVTH